MSKTISWYEAPCLVVLLNEVNVKWPGRSKKSDGMVGDPAHAARKSDHNPDPYSIPPGIVRALDITAKGDMAQQILAAVIGDPRTYYAIHNRVIYSRTRNFRPIPYKGSSPHTEHVHVSILGDDLPTGVATGVANDDRPWFDVVVKVPTLNNVQKARRKIQRAIDLLEQTPAKRLVARNTAKRLRRDLDNLPVQ